MKKVIKLINNERMNRRVVSAKAATRCDTSSVDFCAEVNYDNAHCTVGAYDLCVKDYAACSNYATDYCAPERDSSACFGANETDY